MDIQYFNDFTEEFCEGKSHSVCVKKHMKKSAFISGHRGLANKTIFALPDKKLVHFICRDAPTRLE
jgi:hypothetical protein